MWKLFFLQILVAKKISLADIICNKLAKSFLLAPGALSKLKKKKLAMAKKWNLVQNSDTETKECSFLRNTVVLI